MRLICTKHYENIKESRSRKRMKNAREISLYLEKTSISGKWNVRMELLRIERMAGIKDKIEA